MIERNDLYIDGAWVTPAVSDVITVDEAATGEIIGTVHISEEWRTRADVTPSLELTVGQDFSLSARIVAPGGMQTQLQIVDQRR